MSEQEAEARQRKKRAQESAVNKLPIVKIEDKHCKPIKGMSITTGTNLEAP